MSELPYNTTLGNLRRAVLVLAVLVVVALARPTPWWFAAGLIPVALGEAVRLWAAGHLLKTRELVTSGPYRYTRNPLYLGRLLILTGLTVMANLPYHGSWIVLILGWGMFFLYYLPRKERVEPARLAAEHGEAFLAYQRAVPALFPALRPYRDATGGSWRRERMLRNREHLMVLGLALVSAFWLWRMLATRGAP